MDSILLEFNPALSARMLEAERAGRFRNTGAFIRHIISIYLVWLENWEHLELEQAFDEADGFAFSRQRRQAEIRPWVFRHRGRHGQRVEPRR